MLSLQSLFIKRISLLGERKIFLLSLCRDFPTFFLHRLSRESSQISLLSLHMDFPSSLLHRLCRAGREILHREDRELLPLSSHVDSPTSVLCPLAGQVEKSSHTGKEDQFSYNSLHINFLFYLLCRKKHFSILALPYILLHPISDKQRNLLTQETKDFLPSQYMDFFLFAHSAQGN